MIIKTLLLTGLIASGIFSGDKAIYAPTAPASQTCDISNDAFQGGESLTYKVYYNWGKLWLSGGEVYFKVNQENYQNKAVYHASAEAISYKSFDWFFKVRDEMNTWMDVNTLQSYKSDRDVNEGGYTFYRSYDWNRETNIIASYSDNHKGKKQTKYIKDVDPCGLDLLSTFYWIRTIDVSNYKPGDKIPVSMAVDDQEYDLYVRYEGKEQYKTKLGTFNCLKFKPQLKEGDIFNEGEGMSIWVTDDANRIPVRIETELKVGRITCDLKSYGGTKHPFTSKVN